MIIKKLLKNVSFVVAFATSPLYALNDSVSNILEDKTPPSAQTVVPVTMNSTTLPDHGSANPLEETFPSSMPAQKTHASHASLGHTLLHTSGHILKDLIPILTTMAGQHLFGHFYEHLQHMDWHALSSTMEKVTHLDLSHIDFAHALHHAHEQVHCIGGMIGHFSGKVLLSTKEHLMHGDLFSKAHACDIMHAFMETGLLQVVEVSAEHIAGYLSDYLMRHAIYATASALLGPTGMALALPFWMLLKKSGILTIGMHVFYDIVTHFIEHGAQKTAMMFGTKIQSQKSRVIKALEDFALLFKKPSSALA